MTQLSHLVDNSTQAVLEFRDKFITAADFAQMASYGVNSIRIPIGHWVVMPAPPYIYGRGLAYLDDAVRWAAEFQLTVVLDLHGAVGSQNGQGQG